MEKMYYEVKGKKKDDYLYARWRGYAEDAKGAIDKARKILKIEHEVVIKRIG
jgi:hypothetical protein